MEKPKRNGNEESEEICDGDPLVTGANREHLRGNRPGNCEGVEGLNISSRPNRCSLNSQKVWGLIFDDTRVC